jgi:hypothetical protein
MLWGKLSYKKGLLPFYSTLSKKNAFSSIPYDFATNSCEYFCSNAPNEEVIRLTAYYIWLRQGKPENRDFEHWQEAYKSLCASMGRNEKP